MSDGELTDDAALHREATRLRAEAFREMVRAAGKLRDAEALEQRLFASSNFEILKCCSCRTAFPLWTKEAEWLSARGLSRPRRCKDCRALRRMNRQNDDTRSS